jgi:RNA polymerase-binding transcription factor DksA
MKKNEKNTKNTVTTKQNNKPLQKEEFITPNIEEDVDLNSDVFDEGDIASVIEMGFISNAIKNHQNKLKAEMNPDFDGIHCIDCDEEIPPKRLEIVGVQRCIECQTIYEKKKKMQG